MKKLNQGSWLLLAEDGVIRGPFTTEDIKSEIKSKKLGPQSVIKPEDAKDSDAWNYVFSFVEFRELLPKPVLAKKIVKEDRQESIFLENVEGIKAILHDNIRILEGQVKVLSDDSMALVGIASHRFSVGTRVFVHLYDVKRNFSVNIWALLHTATKHELFFKLEDVPESVQKRYAELCRSFAKKAA